MVTALQELLRQGNSVAEGRILAGDDADNVYISVDAGVDMLNDGMLTDFEEDPDSD